MKQSNRNKLVLDKLQHILQSATKVDFNTLFKEDTEKKVIFEAVDFYLVDQSTLLEIRKLEENVLEIGGKDNPNAFRAYAKIINKEFPCYKYSFLVKKRAREIFDREKVKARLEAEVEKYINRERVKLKDEAQKAELSEDEVRYLERGLEQRLESEKEKIQEVLEDFESYDVVITNHEHCKTYPAIYYTLRTEEKKKSYKKQDSEHLRLGVPNILWYKEEDAFSEYRADMKIEEVIATFDAYCDTIYVKKRG